jgi:hypothetical protein
MYRDALFLLPYLLILALGLTVIGYVQKYRGVEAARFFSIAAYVGGKMLLDVTESLKESALRGDAQVRAVSLDIVDRRIAAGLVSNRDGAVEFLFRILRGDHAPSRRSAAVMLSRSCERPAGMCWETT